MIGAILGDIVGSRFEWRNCKTKDFRLFTAACSPTDDSIMTLAVARAISDCKGDFSGLGSKAVFCMQEIGRLYPDCGFGGRFYKWIFSENPQPYNSYGNGSAMRVSACAWAAKSIEEVKDLSRAVTEVTHNHPEGLKGAEAAAVSVFLARQGSSKEEISRYIQSQYYPLDFTLDSIRPSYTFDVSCQGSVPQALEAFLESDSFEDAIRNAVSIGGDSDTIAAITGAVAEAFYGVPDDLRKEAESYLDKKLLTILRSFEAYYPLTP